MGCHALLQGIFLIQGLNPCLLYLLHWPADFLPLVPPQSSNNHSKNKEGQNPFWVFWGSLLPTFWDKEDTTDVQKGSLWVKSQGMMPGHNESYSSQKPLLEGLPWLRDACTPRGPRAGQVWKKEPDNWAEGRQRPRRTDLYKWFNCLFIELLLLARGMPIPFLSGVHLCLASILTEQTISLYALPLVVINL